MKRPGFFDIFRTRIISGTAWVLLERAAVSLGGLGATALLARLLSPVHMGAYFLIVSIVRTAALLGRFGIETAVIRFIAGSLGVEERDKAKGVVLTALVLAGAGLALVAVVLCAGAGRWLATTVFDSPAMESVVGVSALWAVLLGIQVLISGIFKGFNDLRLSSLFGGIIDKILLVAFLFLLWRLGTELTLSKAVVLTAVLLLLNNLGASLFLGGKLSRLEGFSPFPAKKLLATSLPMLVTSLCYIALVQGSFWILGMFRSDAEIALYGAAIRIVILVATPLLIVETVLSPIVAEMYRRKKIANLEAIARNVASIGGIPAFLAFAALIFFGGPILSFIYGGFYGGAATALLILSLGQIVNVWTGACTPLLNMTGHQRALMTFALASLVLSVAVTLVLVRHFGIAGAAIGSSCAVAFRNLSMLIYIYRKFGIRSYLKLVPDLKVLERY